MTDYHLGEISRAANRLGYRLVQKRNVYKRTVHRPVKQHPLSATMVAALDEAIQHGGKLVRYAGGLWSNPGVTTNTNGEPDWYIHATTMYALSARGKVKFTHQGMVRGVLAPVSAEVVT